MKKNGVQYKSLRVNKSHNLCFPIVPILHYTPAFFSEMKSVLVDLACRHFQIYMITNKVRN